MISVIIPAYNAADYLTEAVESVLGQTNKDFELIIVDDGSTDNTPSMADDYAGRDGRVRVVHTTNNGLSIARNTGLQHARGEYITFLDADDTLHPDALADMLRAATLSGAEITSGRTTKQAETLGCGDGSDVETLAPDDMLERVLRQRDYTYNSSLCGKLFRSELFEANRCTPGTAYEDLDLMPRLIAASRRVAVVHKNLYYYRQHTSSFTYQFTLGHLHVLDVTANLEKWLDSPTAADVVQTPFNFECCRAAARDRHFSAAFNLLNLLNRYSAMPDSSHDLRGKGTSADTDIKTLNEYRHRCWAIIRQHRAEVLRSSRARRKNRIGALLSYLGPAALKTIARITK